MALKSSKEKIYLTKIYGDYMKLPKEAERKGHFESTWGD